MKIKTKKARLIVKSIVCIVLALAILVPATMFSLANDGKIYTSIKDLEGKVLASESLEYYDFNKGLFTSKQVTGPDENGEYTVTIDTYTSNVTYISADNPTMLDVMVLYDKSLSMLSNDRWDNLESGLKGTLTALVSEQYNVGTDKGQNKVNVAMIGYSGTTQSDLSMLDYTALSKANLNSGELHDKLDGLGVPAGATETGNAMKKAYEKVSARMKSKDGKGNKQVVLLFTDGVPGIFTGFENQGSKISFPNSIQTNKAIKYANSLKNMGVEIYTIGCGNDFDEDLSAMNTKTNGLAQWVTSGVTYYDVF